MPQSHGPRCQLDGARRSDSLGVLPDKQKQHYLVYRRATWERFFQMAAALLWKNRSHAALSSNFMGVQSLAVG